MMDYKTILVAVDLEHEAEKVVQRASRLGTDDSKVHVVHVVTPLSDALYANGLGLVSPMLDIENLEQEALQSAQQRLDALIKPYADTAITCDVLIGETVSAIVSQAETMASDVVVLGSHGKKGLQLLLGSTASGVLHHIKCDTLAVRL